VTSTKNIHTEDVDFLFERTSQHPLFEPRISNIIVSLGIKPDLLKAPEQEREIFILQGLRFQVSDIRGVRLMLGPNTDAAKINQMFTGIVIDRPAVVDKTIKEDLKKLPAPKPGSPDTQESGWLFFCSDCKSDTGNRDAKNMPLPPVASLPPAGQPTADSKQKQEEKALTYRIERPCGKTVAAAIEQINGAFAPYGVSVYPLDNYRAIQIFVVPEQSKE
jgi:hypothetical protein